MKKTAKKLTGLLFCLALIAGMMPAVSRPVYAAGVTEVSDMETFKTIMKQDGDVSIRLTADLFEQHGYVRSKKPGGEFPLWAWFIVPWAAAIDHATPWYYDPGGEMIHAPTGALKHDPSYQVPYWLTLGSGNKTVDLQGHSIVVDYPNVFDWRSTMFRIQGGSSLTINDSTGDLGYIHYEGYIFDIEDYDVNHAFYATDMNRNLFEVDGGSLTVNGGTLEAGRSKKQWITNAHSDDGFGGPDWYSSYTGNVTKSVDGTAIIVKSGSLTINGGRLFGRGEACSVIDAKGGYVRVVEGEIDARGSADCLKIDSHADVDLVSGVFLLHKNDVVYDGRYTGVEGDPPYMFHYGRAGQLGFTKYDIDYENVSVSFMDPRPPRHWMVPNSIVKGDGFDLWNEIVAPYGYETFMIVKPVSNTASLCFAADPTSSHPTLNTDSLKVYTDYEPLFKEAAEARGRTLGIMAYYDVYDADTMTLLGHYTAPPEVTLDLISADPGLKDRLVDGKTYFAFSTVIETYEGAYPYEVRSVSCCLFNATSRRPVTVIKQPGTGMLVVPRKGAEVTLTAVAENATDAYWEMTEPYYARLEPTTFQDGKATLTVPVDFEAKYRCQFTNYYHYNPVSETYTYIPTNEVEVGYKPAFELQPGEFRAQHGVQGYDTDIILFHDGQEDTGGPFYGQDYGQAGMYAWYKDDVKLDFQTKNEDGTPHYKASAYWGGGIGLKITQLKASDAGVYDCRCGLDEMPFRSGGVNLDVMQSAGWVYDVDLTGLSDLYVGDLPPALSTVRTNDIRVGVTDFEWANLDAGGHIAADSYYTITVEAQYGAAFDEQMAWSVDGEYADIALVSADGRTAQLVDTHKYDGREDYVEEDDTVVLNQTSFTVYQGRYVPLNGQFNVNRLDCPSAHSTVIGRAHRIGRVEVVDSSDIPWGLTVLEDGFYGEVKADPGVYKVTLRYTIVDAVTGQKHNDCDVDIKFTVLTGGSAPSGEIVHEHIFGDWTSDGPDTHSSSCAGCGENVSYPHDWDEGVVTKTPTKNSNGTMVYTCATCGQTRTETLEYGDYLPPFPEVSEVTVSEAENTVTIDLEEYSGYADDVKLFVAAYDTAGRCVATAVASPDKIGEVTVSLSLARAVKISVFVIDSDSGMIPLTPLYTLDL